MRISKVIFICCFLLPFLASCTRDEIEDNSYPLAEYDGTGVLFRLKAEAFDDTGSATRTVDLTAPFDTLCVYVLKEGQIDIDREVKFPDPATIMVEGLETGTYNLLILAMKGNYKEDGARIHKIEKSSSPWLSFPENTPAKPLKAQYYYTNHKFSVINGKIKIEEIRIPQAVGLVSFDGLFFKSIHTGLFLSYTHHQITPLVFLLIYNTKAITCANRFTTVILFLRKTAGAILPCMQTAAIRGSEA